MKRSISFALALLVALVVTGFAVAQAKQSRQTDAVAATFTATATERTKTRQCTGADGTYDVTRGVYEGTATGDPLLAGKIVIRTESVVNATSGLGWTKGHVALRDADGKLKAKASLVAVVSGGTALNGFMNGRVKEGGHLLANFSAALGADGSSLTGALGSGAALNTAVLTKGSCARVKDEDADEKKADRVKEKAERERKRGEKKADEKRKSEEPAETDD